MKRIVTALLLCVACGLAGAQTAAELRHNKNPDNVLHFGMGNDLRAWSPLKQINKSNVKRLTPVWHFSTATNNGELSQPTVYNGVMYVVNADWTFAIDGGLLFTGKLTGEAIALDIDNGKQLWSFKTGSSINAPPITYTYKGVQYVSVQSGRGGVSSARYTLNTVPEGGSVWTFALMPE